NAGDDRQSLYVTQDATAGVSAVKIENNGGGYGLEIDNSGSLTGYGGLYLTMGSGSEHGAWIYSDEDAGANKPLVFIEADNIGFDTTALKIQNDGTSYGLQIDQNGAGQGLYVDASGGGEGIRVYNNGGTNPAFYARRETTDELVLIGWDSTQTSGNNYFYRNLASADTAGPIMFIEQDNAGDDQTALFVQQDGTGNGIYSLSTGGGDAIKATSTGSGRAGWFFRDQASGVTNTPVMYIEQENAGDDQNALTIQQDGTGTGLFLDVNGNAPSVYIDSEAASQTVMTIDKISTGANPALAVTDNVADSFVHFIRGKASTAANWMYRDYNAGNTTGPLLFLEQDNVDDDQAVLKIQQDGTAGQGVYILQLGESSTSSAFTINRQDNGAQYTTVNLAANRASITGSNYFLRNLNSTYTAGPVMFIEQDNSDDNQNALNIQQDGTGNGIFIDQNGNNEAVYIDAECTTDTVMTVDKVSTGTGATAVFPENTAAT
ncbi:MAG: hypothetical protein ACTSPI_18130, partial [Candidatus Heimdallarchaeaceae archaeon]